MAHLLLLNGPNLNLLGTREPGTYGSVSLEQIVSRASQLAADSGHHLSAFQSNAEAELISRIHEAPASHVACIIFNPAAFTEPAQVRNANGSPITLYGNSARRVGRGPGSSNLDFSLFKNFLVAERLNIQFRAEAFNLSNTPTFTLPSASNQALTIGNANFGKLSSSSATGRQIQFGLKLNF